MFEVSGTFLIGKTMVGIDLSRRTVGDADAPDVFTTVNTDRGGENIAYTVFPVGLASGQASGVLRFLRGQPAAGVPKGMADQLSAGTISWQCGAPDPAAAAVGPGYAPHERTLRMGMGQIHLGGPIDQDLEATAVCQLESFPIGDGESSFGPPQLVDVTLDAHFQDEDLILTSLESDKLTLERLGAGSRVLGEYLATRAGPISAVDPDRPFEANLGPFAFEPTDPRYQPFGGAPGPRMLDISVSVDCSA